MASSAPAAATQLLVQLGRAAMDFAAAEAVAEVEAWVSWSAGGAGGGDGGGGSDRAGNSVFVMGVDANTASAACRASHLLKCLLQVKYQGTWDSGQRLLRPVMRSTTLVAHCIHEPDQQATLGLQDLRLCGGAKPLPNPSYPPPPKGGG